MKRPVSFRYVEGVIRPISAARIKHRNSVNILDLESVVPYPPKVERGSGPPSSSRSVLPFGMPARNDIVFPSHDTSTPEVPVPAHVLLTPDWFDIPERGGPFAPKELAGYLRVSADSIVGLIESGDLLAFPVHLGTRTTWRIPYRAVALYFLKQQGSQN